MKQAIFVLVLTCLNLVLHGGRGSGLWAQPAYREIQVRDGGTIRGVVRLTGDARVAGMEIGKDEDFCGRITPSPRLKVGKNKGVANAIVYLEEIAEGKKFTAGTRPVLDQRKCVYEPHVMVLPAGSSLEIVNSDRILHNVHAYDLQRESRTICNIAQPIKGQRTPIKANVFQNAGLVLATCDAGHPWMSAYIMIAGHPYYAVTDASGKFVLDKVPPGSHRLTMWHEGVAITKTDMDNGKPKKYHFEDAYEVTKEVAVPSKGEVVTDFELILR